MQKIGIITWHYLDNYGSALQAYALQKYIKKQNHKVEIINYRQGAKTGMLISLFRNIKYIIFFNSRKSKFNRFRKKHFSETRMVGTIKELINANYRYDKVICGSDQIWSWKRFDEAYYLAFISSNNTKKYSYAASTMEKYSPAQEKLITNYLSTFEKISVREEKGVEIIQNLTKKKVHEVIDPTLLLQKEEWHSLIKQKKKNVIPKKYILCYLIGDENKYENIVNYYKEVYDCEEIININITGEHKFGKLIKNASPTEFLKYIYNAEAVITDSYHGVLFGINFEKELIAVKRFEENSKDNQNERIYNILRKIGLMERYVNAKDKKTFKNKIDYKIVNKKLDMLREKSYKFLQEEILEDYND